MAVVYKYTLPLTSGLHDIDLPLGAVLSVQVQGSKLVVWMLDAPRSSRATFQLVETGEDFVQREYRYVTTVQVSPTYVLHVWLKDRG